MCAAPGRHTGNVFAELIATEGVREIVEIRGPTLLMALHGGIEKETFPLATAIADAADASLYAVVQPPDLFWHVPSIRYDPSRSRRLRMVIDRSDLAISLHGFGRPGLENAALLGGSNRRVARMLGDRMRRLGLRAIDRIEDIPRGLRGMHRANPVNLPTHGGVQIELGGGIRRQPFTDRVLEAVTDVLWALGSPSLSPGPTG